MTHHKLMKLYYMLNISRYSCLLSIERYVILKKGELKIYLDANFSAKYQVVASFETSEKRFFFQLKRILYILVTTRS